VAETLQSLQAQGQFFITRVPQKLKEVKALLDKQDTLDFTAISEGYSGAWCRSSYAGVAQKWLVIRSEAAGKRERRTLNKHIQANTRLAIKTFKKLCQQHFTCKEDARLALSQWLSQQKYVGVSNESIVEVSCYAKPGRPKKDDVGARVYSIEGSLFTCLEKKAMEEEKKGIFILASNDDSNDLTMLAMLNYYKSQQSVEKGFRFLKSPDFLTSAIFFKKAGAH
jgi:transposase